MRCPGRRRHKRRGREGGHTPRCSRQPLCPGGAGPCRPSPLLAGAGAAAPAPLARAGSGCRHPPPGAQSRRGPRRRQSRAEREARRRSRQQSSGPAGRAASSPPSLHTPPAAPSSAAGGGAGGSGNAQQGGWDVPLPAPSASLSAAVGERISRGSGSAVPARPARGEPRGDGWSPTAAPSAAAGADTSPSRFSSLALAP